MVEAKIGRIVKVAGPVVVAEGMAGARMYDVVRVGNLNLIGEIVELHGDPASIQVYEETGGHRARRTGYRYPGAIECRAWAGPDRKHL